MKKTILFIFLISLSVQVFAQNEVQYMSSQIPFFRGANLCAYQDAFSKTRTEYLREMVSLSQGLMMMGASGEEAVQMLSSFNDLYDRNQAFASRHDQLSLTLESTFKAYLSQVELNVQPIESKLNLINVTSSNIAQMTLMAYGVYSLAPDCRGDIQVTLHVVAKNSQKEISFVAQGLPKNVMSQIALQVFTKFQRTQFPTIVQFASGPLTLVGAANGSVGFVQDPRQAEAYCRSLGARLPESLELEFVDTLGDWSGGVSLNKKVWALNNNYVYASHFPNSAQSRVIHRSQISSTTQFYYYCVKN